jgi:hypothetical protein
MPKDNIIQFPHKEGASRPSRKSIIQNRISELNVENEYLSSDIEYLGQQLDGNISELQVLLKEMENLVLGDLEQSMAEFKNMTGVDLTPLIPEQDNPEED